MGYATNEGLLAKRIQELEAELEELRVLPKVGEWEDLKAELDRLREALRASALAYHLMHPTDLTVTPFEKCEWPQCHNARAAIASVRGEE